MADVEEPKFNSLAERIAALNQQKNFTAPPPAKKRPPPPPPPNKQPSNASTDRVNDGVVAVVGSSPNLPPRPEKREPPALPQRANTVAAAQPTVERAPPALPARPPLPARKPSQASATPTVTATATPTLPPRRNQLGARRGSNSSELSHLSNISNLSLSRTSTASIDSAPARRMLAPPLEQAKLPPLPPSRKDKEVQAAKEIAERERAVAPAPPLLPSRSPTSGLQTEPPGRPSLPPRLPSRPVPKTPSPTQADKPQPTGARRLPPRPPTFLEPKSTPSLQPNSNRADEDAPPPIPVNSRPSHAEIGAATLRVANKAPSCLICRDYSGPDSVAVQYPSHSLPRHDPVGHLANVLCGPFPSPTDKARAIFTWCHHNIAYDAEGFFGNCIQRRDVNDTIFHGKAVCQGYAEVYQAIAQRAGLQCIVVGGHGKGYGHTPTKRGEAPPPKNATGHAWNAVRIDNGQWKLIDACWGAGFVNNQQYEKRFAPFMFTLSNEQFGLSHFPSNDQHFYREDGRILSWEEYITGPIPGAEAPQFLAGITEEGISDKVNYSPRAKHIPVYSGEVVRFQFAKVCEHWSHERNGLGAPYLLFLKIHGVDGRKDDLVPFDTDGFWWWVDVPARDLGAPGMNVQLFALTVLGGRDARGVTRAEFERLKGGGMGYAIWCTWELV